MTIILFLICITLNLSSCDQPEHQFMMGLETANPNHVQEALNMRFKIPQQIKISTYKPQTQQISRTLVSPLDYLLQTHEQSSAVTTIVTIAQQLGFNEIQLLVKAIEKKNTLLATFLLNKQTNFNLATNEGTQLFSHYLALDDQTTAKNIIEKHTGSWQDLSHLVTIAVSYNQPEIVQTLVGKHINLNNNAVFNISPFTAAVEHNNTPIAKYLLSNGAQCISQEASTLLFKAVRNNNQELTKLLLERGAQTRGMSEYAKACGHTKMASYIKEHELAELNL
ncbi:hypothetical protein Noda2021_06170 [Candidatus Dependentiae bacterium Noda2021]|nr:hypothetical protein Noda2021_06170 [Candidatus Dependentiae bacterium Noda2021]